MSDFFRRSVYNNFSRIRLTALIRDRRIPSTHPPQPTRLYRRIFNRIFLLYTMINTIQYFKLLAYKIIISYVEKKHLEIRFVRRNRFSPQNKKQTNNPARPKKKNGFLFSITEVL